MYIGLKQIQNQLTDYPTLLTSSDGIHALTGWSKLQDAPQPLTIHLLYTCVYTPELLSCSLHVFADNARVQTLPLVSRPPRHPYDFPTRSLSPRILSFR